MHFVAVPALIRRAGNDQILSLLENGNGKPINSTISGIIAPEKVKGCEVYFQGRFHGRRCCTQWPLALRRVSYFEGPSAEIIKSEVALPISMCSLGLL